MAATRVRNRERRERLARELEARGSAAFLSLLPGGIRDMGISWWPARKDDASGFWEECPEPLDPLATGLIIEHGGKKYVVEINPIRARALPSEEGMPPAECKADPAG